MIPGQFFFPTAASTATSGSRLAQAGAASPVAIVPAYDQGASSTAFEALSDASFATILAGESAAVARTPTAAPSALAAAKRQLAEAAGPEDPEGPTMSVPSADPAGLMALPQPMAQPDSIDNLDAGAVLSDTAPPVIGAAGLPATASDRAAAPAPATAAKDAAVAGSPSGPRNTPALALPETSAIESGDRVVSSAVDGTPSLPQDQQGTSDDSAAMPAPPPQSQGDRVNSVVQAPFNGAAAVVDTPPVQTTSSGQIDATAADGRVLDQADTATVAEHTRDVRVTAAGAAQIDKPVVATSVPVSPAGLVKPAPAGTNSGVDQLESTEDPGAAATPPASAAASAEKPATVAPTLKTAAPALTTALVTPAPLNADHPPAASVASTSVAEGSTQTVDTQAPDKPSVAATVPASPAKPAPASAEQVAGVQLQTAPQQTDAIPASIARADGSAVQEAARALTAPAAPPAPTAPTPTPTVQVSARIIERHNGRNQRFELSLDPAELGKVDIRIEIGADKKVHAVIAAHDSAALSDLMKGGKALEATLRDAGIDVADGGVKFEVANGGGNNAGANSAGGNSGGGRRAPWEFAQTFNMPLEPETDLPTTQPTVWPPGRLNLVA